MDRDPRLDPLPGDRLIDGAALEGTDLILVVARVGRWVRWQRGGAVPLADVGYWRSVARPWTVLAVADHGDAYDVGPDVPAEVARERTAHLWPPATRPR